MPSVPFKSGLACPKCGLPKSDVTDSRGVSDLSLIRRRRECQSCSHRWTTVECAVDDLETIIAKSRLVDDAVTKLRAMADRLANAGLTS